MNIEITIKKIIGDNASEKTKAIEHIPIKNIEIKIVSILAEKNCFMLSFFTKKKKSN